tara:strand:- start:1659 stop:2249 length:591 start_codon:yes stop_codon:yes gene_type:complete
VGFLKFLKKKNKQKSSSSDNLDLPPPPPHSEHLAKDDLQFPHPDEYKGSHDQPIHKESLPTAKDLSLPDMPKFAHHEDTPTITPKGIPTPSVQHAPVVHKAERPTQPIHTPIKQERISSESRHIGRSLYIDLEIFKNTVRDIVEIRDSIKGADDVLVEFNQLKEVVNKPLNSFGDLVHDMQKKLHSVDKIIYKEVK